MRFPRHSVLLGLTLAVAVLSTRVCADEITIRYLNGSPLPDTSAEGIDLRVSRPTPAHAVTKESKQKVDRFFDEVSAVLAANGVTRDWQLAIPDAPVIEITIDMNGKKLKLVSCHVTLERDRNVVVTELGAQAISVKDRDAVLAKESATFRRHRVAFETILRLSLGRARARLAP